MTRTRCTRPTTSSTSAPARGSTAARWSARARWTRSRPARESITGQYLSGAKRIGVPAERRRGNGKSLKIVGAAENNLKEIDVEIPLGIFTVRDGRLRFGQELADQRGALQAPDAGAHQSARQAGQARGHPAGMENVDKVIDINQSPIGRTPRSNPATYTGVFTDIRELFAQTAGRQDARLQVQPLLLQRQGRPLRGVRGRRHRASIEMHFLPDIYVPCEVCKGQPLQPRDARGEIQGQNRSTTCSK